MGVEAVAVDILRRSVAEPECRPFLLLYSERPVLVAPIAAWTAAYRHMRALSAPAARGVWSHLSVSERVWNGVMWWLWVAMVCVLGRVRVCGSFPRKREVPPGRSWTT